MPGMVHLASHSYIKIQCPCADDKSVCNSIHLNNTSSVQPHQQVHLLLCPTELYWLCPATPASPSADVSNWTIQGWLCANNKSICCNIHLVKRMVSSYFSKSVCFQYPTGWNFLLSHVLKSICFSVQLHNSSQCPHAGGKSICYSIHLDITFIGKSVYLLLTRKIEIVLLRYVQFKNK